MSKHLTPGDIYDLAEHSVDFNSELALAIKNEAIAIDKAWENNQYIEYGDSEQLVNWLKKLSLNLLSQSRTLSSILHYARLNEDWDSEDVKTWPKAIVEAIDNLPTQYRVALDEETGKYLVLAWSPQQGEVVEEMGRVQSEELANALLSKLEQMTYPVEIQQASFDDIAHYKEVIMLSKLIHMDRITPIHEGEKKAFAQDLWGFMSSGKHRKTINYKALNSYLYKKDQLMETFLGSDAGIDEFNEEMEKATGSMGEYVDKVKASLMETHAKKPSSIMKGP